MIEVHPHSKSSLNSTEWKIRVEGRVMGETEEDLLKADSKRFLHFFEKIRVEFHSSTQEDLYPPVEWIKAKSDLGSTFDCFEVTRSVTKEQKKRLGESPIHVKITMYQENNPRKYRVSP